MTDFPTDTHIEALATRVLDTSLPRTEWTHEAHFALALWMLRHRPDESNPGTFRSIIISLNEAHGTPNTDSEGYHHTITVASLGAARAVLHAHSGSVPIADVLADLMAGAFGKPDWIQTYWSRELLFSVEARHDWVGPDLAPLDW